MQHILLLASKSPSRQMLLKEARIPFIVIPQDADELACMTGGSIEDTVLRIAQSKMQHAAVQPGTTVGEKAFILTADTMVQDSVGVVHGKPADRADAIAKLRAARHGNYLATGFCVERRAWDSVAWVTEEHLEQVVTARYVFDIPEHWLDHYLDTTLGLQCAGAAAVEGFGGQFLKRIDGSHSCIIGLPLFEVREALEKLGFFPK
jgi:septum formation protein